MRRRIATMLSALAVLFGAVVLGTAEAPPSTDESLTAAVGAPYGRPGPQGTEHQHNEILVRDEG